MATPRSPVPRAKYQHLVNKYNGLHQNFRRLEADHKSRKTEVERLQEEFEKAQRELSVARDKIQQWKLWIDANPSRNSTNKMLPGNDPPLPIANVDDVRNAQRASEHVGSSQTTETGADDVPDFQAEPQSDDVELVSTRPVKGKRNVAMKPLLSRIKQEPNSPENPIELASEGVSSPPVPPKVSMRTETSDLNALISDAKTPRKRRRISAASPGLEVPKLLQIKSSLSDGDDAQSQIPFALEGHEDIALDRTTTYHCALHGSDRLSKNNVLRQLSPNVPSNPASAAANTISSRKRNHDEMREKVGILSEDGDMDNSQVVTPGHLPIPQSRRNQRLDALLSGPTPDRGPLARRHTPETVLHRSANAPVSKPPKPARTSLPTTTLQPQFKHPVSRPRSPSPPSPSPNDEPLRSRALANLTLTDFKVNPAYLSTDYAFADTIRGREQRRCLPGCTKPSCCGNLFLRAAQTGGLTASKSDPELLEDYLGPDWRHILSGMGELRQDETRMQARAFALASEHGKHRQAFTRAASPPGFWRTGMPSTQEAVEDREKAMLMEREKVEERWREALRVGGRWIFRDE